MWHFVEMARAMVQYINSNHNSRVLQKYCANLPLPFRNFYSANLRLTKTRDYNDFVKFFQKGSKFIPFFTSLITTQEDFEFVEVPVQVVEESEESQPVSPLFDELLSPVAIDPVSELPKCVFCMENKKIFHVYPTCFHAIVCEPCVQIVVSRTPNGPFECPKCRAQSSTITRLFFE